MEDEARQVRSIDDQIKDCEKLAHELRLNVVAISKEKKSAKKPIQRTLFTQMINDIGKKYDAVLAWHPDRSCRNMLEGGQIINMLDEGELKDIRFYSHQFSNDANGKMLLGMLFVFSKQYSDDLSAKVSRGVDGNFNEGKSAGTPKWGYDRNESSGLYAPNEHFELVQNAWRKRANGESVNAIVEYLLDNNLRRMTKDKENSRAIRPYVSSTAKMFRDSFYYGVLVQANQQVDLRDIYDFQPMIDGATYIKCNDKRINELNSRQIDLKSKIIRLEAKIVDPRQIKLSKAESLNVVRTSADKMRAGSAVKKDAYAEFCF